MGRENRARVKDQLCWTISLSWKIVKGVQRVTTSSTACGWERNFLLRSLSCRGPFIRPEKSISSCSYSNKREANTTLLAFHYHGMLASYFPKKGKVISCTITRDSIISLSWICVCMHGPQGQDRIQKELNATEIIETNYLRNKRFRIQVQVGTSLEYMRICFVDKYVSSKI